MTIKNDTEKCIKDKEPVKEKKKSSKPRCHCCNKKLKMVE